jgi:hypothetical protein
MKKAIRLMFMIWIPHNFNLMLLSVAVGGVRPWKKKTKLGDDRTMRTPVPHPSEAVRQRRSMEETSPVFVEKSS